MSAYLGVDLAWGLGTAGRAPNETGLVAMEADGTITDAGWARGVDDVTTWVAEHLGPRSLIAVDASLVVTNPTGIRESERQVGQRYGRWKVAANPTNQASAASAGSRLLDRLTALGVGYVSDTTSMHSRTGPAMFECYPYTTLVGVEELGYDVERPRYKRLDFRVPAAEARARRAEAFDELVRRLRETPLDPPLQLDSNPLTGGSPTRPCCTVRRTSTARTCSTVPCVPGRRRSGSVTATSACRSWVATWASRPTRWTRQAAGRSWWRLRARRSGARAARVDR
ncbi:hypothetical protein QP157_16540 [Sphingomonas sp. LR61]|uniref:hypothetical protein n=1 Tax=Sphingomonas sp. LR61 TaxID=3050234 RepID=UPI002FDF2EA3